MLKFARTFFVSSVISCIITELSIKLPAYLPFLQLHVKDSKYDLFNTHVLLDFSTHTDIYCYSTFDSSSIFYHHLYLHLRLDDTCVVNIFDSFIPVIILKRFRFKCSCVWNTCSIRQIINSVTTSSTAKLTANG